MPGAPKERKETRGELWLSSAAVGRVRRRSEWLVLSGILLLGLALRVAYLSEAATTPEFSAPAIDPGYHDYWARGLVTGDWTPPEGQPDPRITSTPYFVPPGYPYFLALVYRVAGLSYVSPRVMQLLLGLANIGLAFWLARIWYGKTMALVFAGLMSVYWVLIYYEGQLQEPILLVFCILVSLHLIGRWLSNRSWWWAALGGVLLGAASLVRPNALVFVPIAGLWMLWVGRGRAERRRSLLAVTGLVVGAVAAISPATIRNYVVADDFVLISANAGVNLFIGNNEDADGFYYGSLGGLGEFGTCFEYPRIVRQVELATGRPLKYSEVSSYFSARAVKYIREHPGRTLRMTTRKAALFWGPHEISHNRVVHYDRLFSKVLGNLPGDFPLVVAFFALGVASMSLELRRTTVQGGGWTEPQKLSLLILLMVLGYFLSYLPFFSTARFRVPIIPFLLLFGACGLDMLGRLARAKDFRRIAVWSVVVGAVYVVARMSPVPYEPDLAEWLSARGDACHRLNAPDRATVFFKESLKIDPDNPRVYCSLAISLMETGSAAEAVAAWEDALLVAPGNDRAHCDLGSALLLMGRPDEAEPHFEAAVQLQANYPAPYINLANLSAGRGDTDKALQLYGQALRLAPDAPEVHVGMGMVLARRGEFQAAAASIEEALRLQPDWPDAYVNLGVVFKEAGQLREAAASYRRALQLQPADSRTHHNLGVVLDELGETDAAVREFLRAIEVSPEQALTYLRLGALMLEQGQAEPARRYLEVACRLLPDSAEAHFAYAKALERESEIGAARAAFEAVLRIDPDHGPAAEGLTRLREMPERGPPP